MRCADAVVRTCRAEKGSVQICERVGRVQGARARRSAARRVNRRSAYMCALQAALYPGWLRRPMKKCDQATNHILRTKWTLFSRYCEYGIRSAETCAAGARTVPSTRSSVSCAPLYCRTHSLFGPSPRRRSGRCSREGFCIERVFGTLTTQKHKRGPTCMAMGDGGGGSPEPCETCGDTRCRGGTGQHGPIACALWPWAPG